MGGGCLLTREYGMRVNRTVLALQEVSALKSLYSLLLDQLCLLKTPAILQGWQESRHKFMKNFVQQQQESSLNLNQVSASSRLYPDSLLNSHCFQCSTPFPREKRAETVPRWQGLIGQFLLFRACQLLVECLFDLAYYTRLAWSVFKALAIAFMVAGKLAKFLYKIVTVTATAHPS